MKPKPKKDTRKWIVLLERVEFRRPGIYRADVTFSKDGKRAFIHPGGDFGQMGARVLCVSPSTVFFTEKAATEFFVGPGKLMWAIVWHSPARGGDRVALVEHVTVKEGWRPTDSGYAPVYYAKTLNGSPVDVRTTFATEVQAYQHLYDVHRLEDVDRYGGKSGSIAIQSLKLRVKQASKLREKLKKLGVKFRGD